MGDRYEVVGVGIEVDDDGGDGNGEEVEGCAFQFCGEEGELRDLEG